MCVSVCVDMIVCVCICQRVNVSVSLFHQLLLSNSVLPPMYKGEAHISVVSLPFPPFSSQSVTL